MERLRMFPDDYVLFKFNQRRKVWESADLIRRRLWRRYFMGAALITGVLLFVKVGNYIWLYAEHNQLDQQSKSFAEKSIDAIATNWDEKELFARSSPDFITSRSPAVDKQFASLQRIGAGFRDHSCIGSAVIDAKPFFSSVTASYACEVTLKSMPAVVVLSLHRTMHNWKIVGAYVSTPLLA